jgi:hypothetical protein
MPSPRFTVPAADRLSNPATLRNPDQVSESIAQLPYADLPRVARSLLDALSLLNRHPQKVPERARIMAAYRVPCARLLRAPPDQHNTPTSRMMRQLMTEMAYGYKHLINDALAQGNWLKQRVKLSHGLYFAAKHLSLELFLGFEAYQCKVASSWRELLAMYRLAEEQNLHHEPVDDRDQPSPACATIAHVLKRILLLRLQDPCHMVPGEARACYDFLNRYASEAVLENIDATPSPAGRFLLDLEGVDVPRPPDPDSLPQNPNRFRYFNLVPVSRSVHGQLSRMKVGGGEAPDGLQRLRDLTPELLLKRMLHAWHGRNERRDTREETFGWLLCGCGLSAVNHFLLPSDGASSRHGQGHEEVQVQTVGALGNRPARYHRVHCRQVNRSPSGMCIHLRLPCEMLPVVGQVVLLAEDMENRQGRLYTGIVRRRLSIDEDTLEAGIQFIRGRVTPVDVGPADTLQGDRQPALWVEREKTQMSSLLLAPGRYSPGSRLRLANGEQATILELGERVESTPGFERFRIRRTDTA